MLRAALDTTDKGNHPHQRRNRLVLHPGDKVPYSLRHSFAAWSLTLGIDMNRLVRLMGHGSKQMVYEVYGDYIEGLEEDRDNIQAYFGPDFLTPHRKPRLSQNPGERIGESRGKEKRNPAGFR